MVLQSSYKLYRCPWMTGRWQTMFLKLTHIGHFSEKWLSRWRKSRFSQVFFSKTNKNLGKPPRTSIGKVLQSSYKLYRSPWMTGRWQTMFLKSTYIGYFTEKWLSRTSIFLKTNKNPQQIRNRLSRKVLRSTYNQYRCPYQAETWFNDASKSGPKCGKKKKEEERRKNSLSTHILWFFDKS